MARGTAGAAARPALFLATAAALMAALPYLLRGGIHSFIVFDDLPYIAENRMIHGGVTLAGVRWAFGTFLAENWHPLTWLSHMAVASAFGLDATAHHWANVLLHALNSGLLTLALWRMTGHLWRSAGAGAVFALHPLHVESVAWVAERKDVLSGLFFMLALLSYERFVRRGGRARFLAVIACTALGLMAKPMVVTLPLVLLLLDAWPFRRAAARAGEPGAWRRLVLEKAPLFALALGTGILTILAQWSGRAVLSTSLISPGARLANAAVAGATYLFKTVWPHQLAIYYPHPVTYPWWLPASAALLLAAVSAAALRQRQRRPCLLTGWLLFLVMLLPVIGLLQVGMQAMADRYMYLPMAGVIVLGLWGAPQASWATSRPGAVAIGSVSALALAVLALLTFRQVGLWQDEERLYRRTLQVTRDNWVVHNNLGMLFKEKGMREKALAHYEESLRIQPRVTATLVNAGILLLEAGRIEEAEARFRDALRSRPDSGPAHLNLANLLFRSGRREEAFGHYREALRAEPDSTRAHSNFGSALAEAGRPAEAEERFREALRIQPDAAAARYNYGVLLARQGRAAEALDQARALESLDPALAVRLGKIVRPPTR